MFNKTQFNFNNKQGNMRNQVYVCRVGETCKNEECKRTRQHPGENQTVEKDQNNRYLIVDKIDGKCPYGIACQKFDTITVNGNQIRIFKCRYTRNSHLKCKHESSCKFGLNCGYCHTSEEIEFFTEKKLAEERAEQEAIIIATKKIQAKMEAKCLARIEAEKRAQEESVKHAREESERRKNELKKREEELKIKQEEERKKCEEILKEKKKLDEAKDLAKICVQHNVYEYLVVKIVKGSGGAKAEYIGIIKCKGNPKTKNVEPINNTFEKQNISSALHIQNISCPKINGPKDSKMKTITKQYIGKNFIAQYGTSEQKCELLDELSSEFLEDDFFEGETEINIDDL
jgi:hypothetical protein